MPIRNLDDAQLRSAPRMPNDFPLCALSIGHELRLPWLTEREENMENSTDILTIAEVAAAFVARKYTFKTRFAESSAARHE